MNRSWIPLLIFLVLPTLLPAQPQILTLELNMVQQRIFTSANGAPFVFSLTDPARSFLLREGTDLKYGARHLKRAIDRNVVHALSNLIATEQVRELRGIAHGVHIMPLGSDDAVARILEGAELG